MIMPCKTLHSWSRIPRLATIVILFAVASVVAYAQTQDTGSQKPPTTTPEALFQDSTLTATTNTINVNWLPVVTSTGKIIYDDVVIQFDVAADGTLTVSSLQQNQSPHAITDHFKAGNYVGDAQHSDYQIGVTGPALIDGDSGATFWSLSSLPNSNVCTSPDTGGWYVGPIKQNPNYARIKKAGVPLNGPYSYGIGGNDSGVNCPGWNYTTNLLGFVQNGTQLEISNFSNCQGNGNCTDYPEPQITITYTLCNGKNGCKQNK